MLQDDQNPGEDQRTWRELKQLQTTRKSLLHPTQRQLPAVWHQNKCKTTQPARLEKKNKKE